jgi:hypothetical protein
MTQQLAGSHHIRHPHFADNRWYKAEAGPLMTDLKNYLGDAPGQPPAGALVGLIAPHAGYFFSGHVAGAGFAGLTPGAFDTVILLGPDHYGAAPGEISTLQADIWRTPLGDIPVAGDILQALAADIDLTLLARDQEHSLEVELPFLQATLQNFRLVPLMMGTQSSSICQQLAQALVKTLTSPATGEAEGRILFVASSDLSHYFDDATARRLDKTTLHFILALDGEGLLRHIEAGRRRGEPLACGAGPIATLIYAAKTLGATRATLLKYATSADVYPDKSQVVGYTAIAISK